MHKKYLGILGALCVWWANTAGAQNAVPERIFAFGLTHQDHREDIGREPDSRLPVVFQKDQRTWTNRRLPSGGGFLVRRPNRESAIAAIRNLDARMASQYQSNREDLTSLLDYEVEVAFSVTQPVDLSQIETQPELGADVRFYLANDVSLRNIQILGEGRPDRFAFWSASKSFLDFLVLSELPTDLGTPFSLDSWPTLHYSLSVNGQVRQNSSTEFLLYSPRLMLESLREKLGVQVLNPGDIVLTGTCAGTAFKVGAFSRWMGDFLDMPSPKRLSRFLSQLNPAEKAEYLQTGDQIQMTSPELGQISFSVE